MTTITEYLAEQKRLAGAATEGPWAWHSRQTVDGDSWAVFDGKDHVVTDNRDGWVPDAEFIAAARESVPRMIAALEAVAALHRPEKTLPPLGDKRLCAQETCEGFWPCPTIRAVEAALGGGGGE